ncbi:MAG: MBL fold metallo-hydrolase [Oscillospiraceae bacterium]|jgi:Predicted Zn-dependent hydrolases of the beta-lactamase fold|nr:MBL fold metallo-hydrolase [Oscillospiraceae bacterium]
MTIQWLGHACFAITHRGYTVLIDPYNADYTNGYPKLRVKADKLLVSHEHFGHNYREGVQLSGRPESDCPFAVTALRVPHEFKLGNWRGFCDVHILEADGLKLVHMADLGTQLDGGQISRLFGADVCMICAGSATALPSQEAKRVTDEIMAKVIIPMHYRDGNRGGHRLEMVKDFTYHFESPAFIHEYDTDTFTVTPDMEPQVAVLKYLGPEAWGALAQEPERREKPSLLRRLLRGK